MHEIDSLFACKTCAFLAFFHFDTFSWLFLYVLSTNIVKPREYHHRANGCSQILHFSAVFWLFYIRNTKNIQKYAGIVGDIRPALQNYTFFCNILILFAKLSKYCIKISENCYALDISLIFARFYNTFCKTAWKHTVK